MDSQSELIIKTARHEIQQEEFRAAVIKEKQRMLQKRWWHALLPFTVTIKWRNK